MAKKAVKKAVKTSNNKFILVVDDEPDIRETVQTVLESEGYKVKTAVSGEDALKKLKTEKPDLVIMDIMMPGPPVREIIKKIRQPICFLSAVRTSEAEKEEIFSSGNIVDYIQKPFDIKELIERIKKILK